MEKENSKMANEKKYDPTGKEIIEYPKIIYLSDKTSVVVNSEKEEIAALKDEPKSEKTSW